VRGQTSRRPNNLFSAGPNVPPPFFVCYTKLQFAVRENGANVVEDVMRGEMVDSDLDRLITGRADRGSRPDALEPSYLASRPEQQKAWEKYTAARGEADDVGRQVGHALSFGLMMPPELDAYPVRAPSEDGASG
jgi:hypothetical protein